MDNNEDTAKKKQKIKYKILRMVGFLPFEAKALSSEPINTPYMQGLIKERDKLLIESVRERITERGYENKIKDIYRQKEWGKFDPMLMLEDAKKRFNK